MEREPLGTRKEVARFCRVSEATVARWASDDTGPPYVVIGRHARYSWPAVERWLATRARGTRGAA